MSKPRRILIVGNFGRKGLYRRYFNTEAKLANGFIRSGHHVLNFSDRDHAREATIWGTQKAGRRKLALQLLEVATHYQPHMILFSHVDLLPNSLFQQLRDTTPDVKLAALCVDALFRDATIARFVARAQEMDTAFITTGDRVLLKELGLPGGRLYFLPNPVDESMESERAFEVRREDLGFDGQFLGTGIDKREAQLDAIQVGLPAGYRFHCGGKAYASERIDSTAFLLKLADSAVCPNLPLDDLNTKQLHKLYSSDRIAQTLGQGVTTLTIKACQLSELYEDGVVEYENRASLVEHMRDLFHDDEKRRRIGERGHFIAHSRTNATRIANYILSRTMGEGNPEIFWDGSPV
ncbi:MAG: glycosyltransferase [Hyphomicrobiales bacterium]